MLGLSSGQLGAAAMPRLDAHALSPAISDCPAPALLGSPSLCPAPAFTQWPLGLDASTSWPTSAIPSSGLSQAGGDALLPSGPSGGGGGCTDSVLPGVPWGGSKRLKLEDDVHASTPAWDARSTHNEKNRDAQRRFRQRQREALASLEARVHEQELQLQAMQRERRMMYAHNEMLLNKLKQYESQSAQHSAQVEGLLAQQQALQERLAQPPQQGEAVQAYLCCLCGSALLDT